MKDGQLRADSASSARADAKQITMDWLEPRMFLSVAPIPVVQNGILKIWGTPGDDTITVQTAGFDTMTGGPTEYDVVVDGVTTTFPYAGIRGVRVHAGAGNDSIDLYIEAPNTVPGSNGETVLLLPNTDQTVVMVPATVFGGRGDDSIIGSGAPCVLRGGPGNDTITGYGQIYGGQGNDNITVSAYNTSVNGGLGDDTIYNGTQPTDTVLGGGGNDTIEGSSTPYNLPQTYYID
jgi:Ca2+-binding RTX toxin-like protein